MVANLENSVFSLCWIDIYPLLIFILFYYSTCYESVEEITTVNFTQNRKLLCGDGVQRCSICLRCMNICLGVGFDPHTGKKVLIKGYLLLELARGRAVFWVYSARKGGCKQLTCLSD